MIGKDVHSSQILERRKRQGRFGKFLSLFILVTLFLDGAAWFVLRSGALRVQSVTVTGNTEVPSEEIIGLARASIMNEPGLGRFLGFKNYVSWPKKFDEASLRFIPRVKSVNIEKHIGSRSINLVVEERVPYGVWCYREHDPPECLWFDEDGILFKRSLVVEGNLIHTVNDYTNSMPRLGSTVIPEASVPHLLGIFEVVRDSGLNVREVRFEHAELEELAVTTDGAPDLYFSLRFPPTGALVVIKSLREKKELSKLQYIDFRVENRAYYK